MNTYYITTAIPFVNAKPHIGFALEAIITDTLARYQRQRGKDVRFLTGSDENSLKNVQAAEQEGISTAALVARNAQYFAALREPLNLSYDDFIRTSTDPRHRQGVAKLWLACQYNGDIYKRNYQGLYCVGCEQFYNQSELIDNVCPEHQKPLELIEEENYFFRLSHYQQTLSDLIESDQLSIKPAKRRNEVLSFIQQGLQDFSISRSASRAKNWGLPVPGDPEQVIYVWFDALSNYINALDYAQEGSLYQHYWNSASTRVHVIGKGISRFHAVYWPALLLSAGLPLPTTLLVHGYVTADGKKIGKSLGNTIDPVVLAEQFGCDALRYYLLRHIRSDDDGDFSRQRLLQVYNTELADQLGNLLNRSLGLLQRYAERVVPEAGKLTELETWLLQLAEQLDARVATAVADFQLHNALAAIWELVAATNKYINDSVPWQLAKQTEAADRLASVLFHIIEALRLIAYHLAPFLPATATAIQQQLRTDKFFRSSQILFPKTNIS